MYIFRTLEYLDSGPRRANLEEENHTQQNPVHILYSMMESENYCLEGQTHSGGTATCVVCQLFEGGYVCITLSLMFNSNRCTLTYMM